MFHGDSQHLPRRLLGYTVRVFNPDLSLRLLLSLCGIR